MDCLPFNSTIERYSKDLDQYIGLFFVFSSHQKKRGQYIGLILCCPFDSKELCAEILASASFSVINHVCLNSGVMYFQFCNCVVLAVLAYKDQYGSQPINAKKAINAGNGTSAGDSGILFIGSV